MQKKNVIIANNYDDLRDMLPNSGLFEFTDCAIEIWCPEFAQADEIQRMVRLLESMVHVTDVRVGSDIENLTSEDYRVVIIEDKNDIGRKNYIGDR